MYSSISLGVFFSGSMLVVTLLFLAGPAAFKDALDGPRTIPVDCITLVGVEQERVLRLLGKRARLAGDARRVEALLIASSASNPSVRDLRPPYGLLRKTTGK